MRHGLDDPERPVAAVEPLRAVDLGEARADEPPPVEHRADPGSLRHEVQARTWRCTSAAGCERSTTAYSGSKSLLVLPAHLRHTGVAGLELREHLRQQPAGRDLEVRDQRLLGVVGADRNRLLSQDVAGVERRVHEVIRHPDLGLAGADRPGPRMRPATLREHRRMAVHDPERRRVDRLLR